MTEESKPIKISLKHSQELAYLTHQFIKNKQRESDSFYKAQDKSWKELGGKMSERGDWL